MSVPEAVDRRAAEPDDRWAIADRGDRLLVGPGRALADHPDLRATVALVDPVHANDLGPVVAERRISESGLRDFVVTWHRSPDGRTTAVNPAGGNQISWSEPGDDVRVTAASDAHITSVHVRFVLRHLTTALLEADLAGRSVHAVTATLISAAGHAGPRRVMAVAGPTTSGKTRLVNQLIVAGLLDEVVDDDCPVVGPDGAWTTLIPRRYEVTRASSVEPVVLAVLSDAVEATRAIDLERAHDLLATAPVPWPAGWLPASESGRLPPLRDGLVVLEVPARDDQAHRSVLELVASSLP